ncbi:uncharacterized protein LOC121246780 [Juglans microcarpa x Juglans regia]|uniref:uncharacterized protein LOC121246780 n=1 Tax=Juglans microcarpa x Juglans regia TaxID=2249226 RepID=UPI001B7E818A|nr:uncharacterized protein LOC121246780 [Juglans microcarpa x Juglans regia]
MKILSWNCRGLGNPRTVQDLHLMVKERNPGIVFLIETKLMAKKLEGIKRRMKWEGCFVMEPVGRKRGLVMLWREDVELEILNYSQHHISAYIGRKDRWVLTGFYSHPEASKRKETWRLLSLIKPVEQMPWCIIGDFNKVLSQEEKEGGMPRPEVQMQEFRQVLEDNSLFDLGWMRSRFTWSNRHEDQSFTKERLDRAVANHSWAVNFRNNKVDVLITRQSDHKALLLSMNMVDTVFKRMRRVFRFEAK